MPTIEQARAWYYEADPVHDFDHILRVYSMAERLAQTEGGDLEIIRAAALLHDVQGGAPGSETRATHHLRSADFAGEVLAAEGWSAEKIAAVQHCIRGHRFRGNDEAPETIEAKIIFDSDKLDVLGAIGAVRVIAYATINGQPIYTEPSPLFLQSGEKMPGEPHSAYHEYLFKLRKIKDRLFTQSARRLAMEREQYLDEFFRRLAAEMKGAA